MSGDWGGRCWGCGWSRHSWGGTAAGADPAGGFGTGLEGIGLLGDMGKFVTVMGLETATGEGAGGPPPPTPNGVECGVMLEGELLGDAGGEEFAGVARGGLGELLLLGELLHVAGGEEGLPIAGVIETGKKVNGALVTTGTEARVVVGVEVAGVTAGDPGDD